MDVYLIDLAKLLAAIVAGALIGLERELADKPAGLRTNILICLGAALFALLSVRLSDASALVDPARVAAQIVTGVGFLGAGAIIQHRNHVIGLTTAATIWAVASVGMAFGTGFFLLGLLGTLLTAAVLFGMGFAETRIARWRTVGRFEAEVDLGIDPTALLERIAARYNVQWRNVAFNKTGATLTGTFKVVGPAEQVTALQDALTRESSVRVLKRL